MSQEQQQWERLARIRADCDALVDELAADEDQADVDRPAGGGPAAALARVDHVAVVRERVTELVEEMLDDAIAAARIARPRGATWQQLGARLGMSGQAVGQRLAAREGRVKRTIPPRDRRSRYLSPLAPELMPGSGAPMTPDPGRVTGELVDAVERDGGRRAAGTREDGRPRSSKAAASKRARKRGRKHR